MTILVVISLNIVESANAGGTCKCQEYCGHNPPITAENIVSSEAACGDACIPQLGACYLYIEEELVHCGDHWTNWRNIPNDGVGNPCPVDCPIRGRELGKSYRTVDFFKPQDKTKFECYKNG